MAMKVTGGFILDENGEQVAKDVYIKDGKIVEHVADGDIREQFDATGLLISPGFVDVHVHLREPGGEKKETIKQELKPRHGVALRQWQLCPIRALSLTMLSNWTCCKRVFRKRQWCACFRMLRLQQGNLAKS